MYQYFIKKVNLQIYYVEASMHTKFRRECPISFICGDMEIDSAALFRK
jgi:hypothetical protein